MDRFDRVSTLKRLLEAKRDIANQLYQHQDCLKSLRTQSSTSSSSTNHEYSVDTILKYSSNISYAMHAPKQYFIGMKLLNYHPPAPQAEEMRDGMLQKYYLRLRRNNVRVDLGSRNSSIVDQVASDQKQFDQQSFVDELKNKLQLRRTTGNKMSTSTFVLKKGNKSTFIKINSDTCVADNDIASKANQFPTTNIQTINQPAASVVEQLIDKAVGIKRMRAANLAFTYSNDEESSSDDD
jgi:hypothetical protein